MARKYVCGLRRIIAVDESQGCSKQQAIKRIDHLFDLGDDAVLDDAVLAVENISTHGDSGIEQTATLNSGITDACDRIRGFLHRGGRRP